jgi:hypothetical protein
MPVQLQTLPDEPILLIDLLHPLDLDAAHFAETLQATLDFSPVPLFVIANATALSLSLADMAGVLAMISRAEMVLLRHPKVAGYCAVLGSQARTIPVPPNMPCEIPVSVSRTLDEALTLARSAILHSAR